MARPVNEFTSLHDSSVVEVKRGDTLESLLRDLGFDGHLLTELMLGLSTEIDPDHLEAGHRLEVIWSERSAGEPERLVLSLGDETIELKISEVYRSDEHGHGHETEWSEQAISVTVEDTLVATIERAGAPADLGMDIAASLAGRVDFRRDIHGGEPVEVLYRQEVDADGEPAGRAELRYAQITIGERVFEIASQVESGMPLQVFEDGKSVQVSASPVAGARVSSHFGQRKHPVLGVVRMHTGVDYAAKEGTPVFSSAPGTVVFKGTRGGYGEVIDIDHGADLMTRYAHLSSYAEGLDVGDSVEAGEQIGEVGATGLATGPHLHYEVRYAGRPVDPLSDARIAALVPPVADEPADAVLQSLRDGLAQALDGTGSAKSRASDPMEPDLAS